MSLTAFSRPAHHLIVGGQRSGKSRFAERLAAEWLRAGAHHRVSVVATAQAWDDEMCERIRRHQADRPPAMATVEEPRHLGHALRVHARPERLLLVDCLTLYLTNWLMPADGAPDAAGWEAERRSMLLALAEVPSPVVLVSNEVGWGVTPLGRELRAFVDELGRLNQAVAARCARLTMMVAGQPWTRPVMREDGHE